MLAACETASLMSGAIDGLAAASFWRTASEGLVQQPHQVMAWNVAPQPDAGGEFVVVLRPPGERGVAAVGKSRAGIAGGAEHHRLVAALDQHVGQRFVERTAPRDGEQMALTFGERGFQQSIVVEPLRSLEQRSGDVDGVVRSEETADPLRRARFQRQPLSRNWRAPTARWVAAMRISTSSNSPI